VTSRTTTLNRQPSFPRSLTPAQELLRVAKRVVWFKPPQETLKDPQLFLAYFMAHGTLGDPIVAMKYYGDEDFEQVLSDPPPRGLR
jgi:hypothetical protein